MSFEAEVLHYFPNATEKKNGGVKDNMYRIDQKVTEYENQGKKPGSKYVQDMLRASALYHKKDLDKLYDDLKLFIADN